MGLSARFSVLIRWGKSNTKVHTGRKLRDPGTETGQGIPKTADTGRSQAQTQARFLLEPAEQEPELLTQFLTSGSQNIERVSIVLSHPVQGVCDCSCSELTLYDSATVISAFRGFWFLIVLGMISFISSFDLRPRNLTAIHWSSPRFGVWYNIYFLWLLRIIIKK